MAEYDANYEPDYKLIAFNTIANKDMVGYCELIQSDGFRKAQCDNKKLPQLTSAETAKLSAKGASLLKNPPTPKAPPQGWIDITDKSIDKLKLNCKKHVFMARRGGKKLPHLTDVPKWAKVIEKDQSWAEKILCAEDNFPEAARNAFGPVMGDRYFPPQIKKTGSHNMELSCGVEPGEAPIQLDIYGRDAENYKHSKDPRGKDVSKSFKKLKMDGGRTDVSDPGGGHALYWLAKKDSEGWIRRRGNGGPIPTMEGGQMARSCHGTSKIVKRHHPKWRETFGGPEAKAQAVKWNKIWKRSPHDHWYKTDAYGVPKYNKPSIHASKWENKVNDVGWCPNGIDGYYRPNLSSTTNTCCPSKGLPIRQYRNYHSLVSGTYQ